MAVTRCISFPACLVFAAVFVLILRSPAEAQGQGVPTCGLALVLAVDVSPSVDGHEFKLQMTGTAEALRHPAVANAIKATAGGVAVTMTLWANDKFQRQVVDWRLLHNDGSIAAAAQDMDQVLWPQIPEGTGTGLGAAILHGTKMIFDSPYRCARQVIDVSGDGQNITGPEPAEIRDRVTPLGITVNGLAIYSDEETLVDYFRDNVIGGAGAFVIGIETYDDFATAIRKKLLREIQPRLAHRDR